MVFIDIHTHNTTSEDNIIAIKNVSVKDFKHLSSCLAYVSLGIHPCDIEKSTDTDFELLEEYASDKRVKLIGECGLDKNAPSNFDKQLLFFKRQIYISEKHKKPLIIHCVGYFNELFQLKKELHPLQKWIIHGFRGKPQLAEQAVKNGFYLSFGEKHNTASIMATPLEYLLVETDESKKSIKEIYKSISETKNCNVTDLITAQSIINM